MITPAQQLLRWADILRDFSALGLHYANDIYERERWQQVQSMVIEMMAYATGDMPAELEPLRAPVLGRPTPFSVCDAAVINEAGQMLLIQRADNGLWALPGGALEVGETPAEGAIRETLEETGVTCEVVELVGIFDSRYLGNAESRHHMYQIVFLGRPISMIPAHEASFAHEVKQIGWFAEDALPATLDPGHAQRIPIAFQVWRGERTAFFDQP